MVEFATQYEVDNFKDFDLRPLTFLDAMEFTKAQNESYMELSNYFDVNHFSKPRDFISSFNDLMLTIRSQEVDLYGLFQGRRLLGIGLYHPLTYSDYGCEIVYYVRSSEAHKGIGTYLLKRLTLHAIYEKKFRFTSILIDETNLASRAIGKKIGYEHIENFDGHTEGRKASGVYCRFMCFDTTIDFLAEEYERRKIDLIEHPGYYKELRDLIFDDQFNETFKWPYPILEQRSSRIEAPKPKPRRPRKTPYRTQMFSNSPIPRYKDE
jgi:RimJ/RimL family protein N-acetyltransferase